MPSIFRLIQIVCLCFIAVGLTSVRVSAENGSVTTDQIVRYFERNALTLGAANSVEIARVAFSQGRRDLCESFMRSLSKSELMSVVSTSAHSGDEAFISFLLSTINNTVEADTFRSIVMLAISAFANAGHYDAAVRTANTWDNIIASEARTKAIATYAYLRGDSSRFQQLVSAAGLPRESVEQLTTELNERRDGFAAMMKVRDKLGISAKWDALLRHYRLGECLILDDQTGFEAQIAEKHLAEDKIRGWFCWSAVAAAQGQKAKTKKGIVQIQSLTREHPGLRRSWLPEVLFLITHTDDRKLLLDFLNNSGGIDVPPPAAIAAIATLGSVEEIADYLNTRESLDASMAATFVDFVSADKLDEVLMRLESETFQIQVAARMLTMQFKNE